MSIKFEDPPPPRRRGKKSPFAEIAQELKASPGQWAVIAKYDKVDRPRAMVVAINSGRYSIWEPAGHFEAVSRLVEGEYCLYARYLGEEDDDE